MESSQAELPQQSARLLGMAGLLRDLLPFLRPYWGKSLLVVGAAAIELLFNTAFPLSFKFIIDRAIVPHNGRLLIGLLLGLGALFVLSGAAGIGRKYVTAVVGARVLNDIRRKLFDHLQRLPVAFYVQADSGDLLSHFTNDLAAIENALLRSLPLAALSALEVGLSAVLLCLLEWRLGLLTIALLPLAVVGPRLIAPGATAASYARKKMEAVVASVVQENIAAQAVIKALRLQQVESAKFEDELGRLAGASFRLGFLSGLVGRTGDLGIIFVQLVIIGTGAYLAFAGALSIGALFGFMGLLLNLGTSLFDLTQALPDWIQAAGGMGRVDELLAVPVTMEDRPDAVALPPFRQEIRLDHVSFGYVDQHRSLNDTSLCIRAGEHVAFVGRNGAGKSTILSLLARFYDPEEGAILIDGQDTRSVTQESLRSQVAMVFQEPLLFRGTIRANILRGNPDASQAEVEAAARAVDIHDLIVSMPAGYDTVVGERGGTLSGGQRQRIALARALVGQPAVLLLDEVTSALDPHTEAAINATIEYLARRHTIVEVTHRLASVVQCDRIFALADSTVAEEGSHAQLLAHDGVYARLWNEQAGFTISEDGRAAAVSATRLAAIPVFQHMRQDNLEELAARFTSERYDEDELVVHEGDPGNKFYIIARGQVEVIRSLGDSPLRLAMLQDGDFFGEIALLRDVARTASVRTRSHSLLLSLSRPDFLDLVNQEPELARAVEQAAAARMEEIQPSPATAREG